MKSLLARIKNYYLLTNWTNCLLTFDPQNTQGLIFVVDSNDRERIAEAQDELQKMVSDVFILLYSLPAKDMIQETVLKESS